jgi:hypothetical protein
MACISDCLVWPRGNRVGGGRTQACFEDDEDIFFLFSNRCNALLRAALQLVNTCRLVDKPVYLNSLYVLAPDKVRLCQPSVSLSAASLKFHVQYCPRPGLRGVSDPFS